ncbi:hypothetical protein BS78_09G042200, partial [Paspalum vaginatum]
RRCPGTVASRRCRDGLLYRLSSCLEPTPPRLLRRPRHLLRHRPFATPPSPAASPPPPASRALLHLAAPSLFSISFLFAGSPPWCHTHCLSHPSPTRRAPLPRAAIGAAFSAGLRPPPCDSRRLLLLLVATSPPRIDLRSRICRRLTHPRLLAPICLSTAAGSPTPLPLRRLPSERARTGGCRGPRRRSRRHDPPRAPRRR